MCTSACTWLHGQAQISSQVLLVLVGDLMENLWIELKIWMFLDFIMYWQYSTLDIHSNKADSNWDLRVGGRWEDGASVSAGLLRGLETTLGDNVSELFVYDCYDLWPAALRWRLLLCPALFHHGGEMSRLIWLLHADHPLLDLCLLSDL